MSNRLLELRERRARLIERAQGERERLATLVSRADPVFTWIGVGRRVADEVRSQPLLVVLGAAALLALRPRRTLKLLASGWSLWQLYQRARRWWLRLAPAGAQSRSAV